MIEKMYSVCVVSSLGGRDRMLNALRELGLLHIKQKKNADAQVSQRFADLSSARSVLAELPQAGYERPVLPDSDFDRLNERVVMAIDARKHYSDLILSTAMERDRQAPWGDFEPAQIRELQDMGIALYFYRMGKKEFSLLASAGDTDYIRLSPVDRMETVAVVGKPLPSSFPANAFILPEKSISTLDKELEEYRAKVEHCSKVLGEAAPELASYRAQLVRCVNDMEFSSAERTLERDTDLVWLSGYIPKDSMPAFEEAAKANSWAYAFSEVEPDDEHVPTKIRYSKVSRLMEPVFDILGTVPGYREYDISFWFLCFFSLFFAMIIGDAGYGLCFLAVGILLNVKQKRVTNLTLLVYVVSAATILWGSVTGTWFGLEGAMNVPFLRRLVIPELANYPQYFGYTATQQQNVMMQFCFILGTIQLSLACIMNIRRKISERNLSLVADIGWLMSINALYYVVLLLVIGSNADLALCAYAIVAGFVLVCLFGSMEPGVPFSKGLKAGLGNAFTNFLNTISAFGNIMSYIRLFAVGLASLAIAQSFNEMAMSMTGFMRVFGVLVFLLGHVLNLVMGLLSVIVHGVRLNLLEFSGQLGMEWSGTAYEPFRVTNKER